MLCVIDGFRTCVDQILNIIGVVKDCDVHLHPDASVNFIASKLLNINVDYKSTASPRLS